MSYRDSELVNSCYLILTSGISALFHDLIVKADKTVYLINYEVYFGGNWQDEERFYDEMKSCKFKPIITVFNDVVDFLIYWYQNIIIPFHFV